MANITRMTVTRLEATDATATSINTAGGVTAAGALIAGTNVSDSVGTLDAVRDGGLTLASQAAGDIFYATSASQLGRVNGTGLVQANGSGAATIVALSAVGAERLLGSGSGTSTAGAATNVFTLAITGLTALDALRVVVTMATVGGTTTIAPELYNVTDSVVIATSGNVAASTSALWDATLAPSPTSTTSIKAMTQLLNNASYSTPVTAGAAFVTAWTGSWTLALRTGASGTDGTFHYAVRVYKVFGQ
jgi:hypothetical protein